MEFMSHFVYFEGAKVGVNFDFVESFDLEHEIGIGEVLKIFMASKEEINILNQDDVKFFKEKIANI